MLKRYLISTFSFFLLSIGYAQKNEVNINAMTGTFFFRGSGAATSCQFVADNITGRDEDAYFMFTPSSYGKKSNYAYAIEVDVKHVTKLKTLYGASAGFEYFSTAVPVDSATFKSPYFIQIYKTSGGVTSINNYFSINPYIGKRYNYKNISVDYTLGVDLAFCSKSTSVAKFGNYDAASGTQTGIIVGESMPIQRAKPFVDVRPRFQIKMNINRVGVMVGYSLGLTPYTANVTNTKIYASFFRLGVGYKIN